MVLVLQTLHLATQSASLAGSGQQCERKTAILDKSGNYTFHFEACKSDDPSSVCHLNTESLLCDQTKCDSIQGVGSITRAQFTDGMCEGTIQYPENDKSMFTVS